mmetsp:Transcript_43751/g.73803  ORF Transcript_43751/g.73803 Transcript_43751/m.73803 type:complete len:237 (-) Transcript_43751:1259-1969(-)
MGCKILQHVIPSCLVDGFLLLGGCLQPAGNLPCDLANAGPVHNVVPHSGNGYLVKIVWKSTVHLQRRRHLIIRVFNAYCTRANLRHDASNLCANGHTERTLHTFVHRLRHGQTKPLFAAELHPHWRCSHKSVDLQMVHLSASVTLVLGSVLCNQSPLRIAHQLVCCIPLRLTEIDELRIVVLLRQKGVCSGFSNHIEIQQLLNHLPRGICDHLHDFIVNPRALVISHGLRLRDTGH